MKPSQPTYYPPEGASFEIKQVACYERLNGRERDRFDTLAPGHERILVKVTAPYRYHKAGDFLIYDRPRDF